MQELETRSNALAGERDTHHAATAELDGADQTARASACWRTTRQRDSLQVTRARAREVDRRRPHCRSAADWRNLHAPESAGADRRVPGRHRARNSARSTRKKNGGGGNRRGSQRRAKRFPNPWRSASWNSKRSAASAIAPKRNCGAAPERRSGTARPDRHAARGVLAAARAQGIARRDSVASRLYDRIGEAAVRRARNGGGGLPSAGACWPISWKWIRRTSGRRKNFCTTSWNTWWWRTGSRPSAGMELHARRPREGRATFLVQWKAGVQPQRRRSHPAGDLPRLTRLSSGSPTASPGRRSICCRAWPIAVIAEDRAEAQRLAEAYPRPLFSAARRSLLPRPHADAAERKRPAVRWP